MSKSIIKELAKENNEKFNNFIETLDSITTLDLEDDQVHFPTFVDDEVNFIFQIKQIYFYIRNRDELPTSGSFEIYILDVDDNVIGFIRGSKNPKIISFSLIYLIEEHQGYGIGTKIYRYFLDNGYIVKSDKEITDGTNSLYVSLIKKGYKPLVFDDGRVGIKS